MSKQSSTYIDLSDSLTAAIDTGNRAEVDLVALRITEAFLGKRLSITQHAELVSDIITFEDSLPRC